MTRPQGGGVAWEMRLAELLRAKTIPERATFLMQYAAAHGRKYECFYDAKGYKRRRRKPSRNQS